MVRMHIEFHGSKYSDDISMFGRYKTDQSAQKRQEVVERQEKEEIERGRQKLLDAKAYRKNPNAVLSDDYRMLEKMLRNSDLDGVMKCLEDGADPNIPMYHGNSALYFTLDNVNSDVRDMVLEALLIYGADPNGSVKDNYAPIYKAYNVSNHEAMKLLLQHGADASLELHNSYNLPYTLVRNNRYEEINLVAKHSLNKFELSQAFKVAAKDNTSSGSFSQNQMSKFWHAAMKTETPYKNMPEGQSFLHDLVQRGKDKEVRALVEKHGYQDAVNHQGRTLLHLAVALKNTHLTGYLMTKGANLHAVDHMGYNVADIAIENGVEDHPINKILKQKQVVPNFFDDVDVSKDTPKIRPAVKPTPLRVQK